MDQFSNKPERDNNNSGQEHGSKEDNSRVDGEFSTLSRGMIVGFEGVAEEERIVGVIPAKLVQHEDHHHLVLEDGGIGRVQAEAMNLRTIEDAERALHGDSGRPTNSTSVGYNRKFGAGWDRLFGNN